jgi:hypothetical protein
MLRIAYFLLMWSCVALFAQDASKSAERLKKAYPKVQWNVDSATSLDIDCDGLQDTFYWGIDPEVPHTYLIGGKKQNYVYREVALGFEFGSHAKPQKDNVPFIKNTGYYGFRSEPNKIDVQPLSCDWEGGTIPSCVKKEHCQSLWVRDGQDGEVFVFWDSQRKQVNWVRH